MKPSKIIAAELVEPAWVVRDMLPKGTTVILAGEPGAGKSFLSYLLAYSVCSGLPFLGHTTYPCNVVYFDEENGEPDFYQYNRWVWNGLGQPDLPTLDDRLRLEHGALVAGWRERMHTIIEEHRPGLVIVDTATPAFSIKDENDNSEANEVLRHLRLFRRYGDNTTYLILKHERQRDEVGHRRTIRGAKTWLGAVDQVMYHAVGRGRRRKDGLRKTRLEPDKMRAFGLRYVLELDPIWTDPDRKGLILHAKPVAHEESPSND